MKRTVDLTLNGYVMTENIYNRQGVLLLKAGIRLNAATIRLLLKNGVSHVRAAKHSC